MTVIDVDSHWWEPLGWLDEADPALADEVERSVPPQGFAEVVFGEVIAELPPAQQAAFLALLPARLGAGGGRGARGAELEKRLADSPIARIVNQKGARDAAARLEACDEQGIDVQLVNPTLALGELQRLRRHRPELLPRLCRAYNDWSADRVAGHTDRLVPTALVDLADPAAAIAELARMRGRGSRAWLVPLHPVGDRSIAHVDFEPVWAASVDLGMIPVMHVATGSVVFDPAWCETGRPDAARAAFLLASSQNAQIPQIPLAALVLNGVFERHPRLVVLCSEFGLSWVPGWLDKLGPASRDGTPNIGALLGWSLPRRAQDYVATNVRFSPLRGQRVDELIRVLGPESVCFASDYPHPEGSATARADFSRALEERASDADRERFFGGNAAALLAAGA